MTELCAVGSESKIVLSWENPADEDFYGVWISEKNNAGTLANPVFVKSPANTFIVSELENAVEYEFSIIAIDNSLNQSLSKAISASPVDTSDKTPPSEVTGLTVSVSDGYAVISWASPTDSDFAGVKISLSPAVGTLTNPIEVAKNVTSISVSGLTVGESYTFTVTSFDTTKNYSNGVSKTASIEENNLENEDDNSQETDVDYYIENDILYVNHWPKDENGEPLFLEDYIPESGKVILNDSCEIVYLWGSQKAKSLYISSGVKQIVYPQLYSLSSLEEIQFADDSIISIGENAFAHCGKLKAINFPNTLQVIDRGNFAYCKNLETVTFPVNLKIVGGFYNCSKLKEVSLPDSLIKLEKDSFSGCTQLEKVKLSANLRCIENGSFERCPKIKEIEIPNSITCIEEFVFYDCTGLETVVLYDNVKEIDKYSAFKNCPIKTLKIGNSISYCAFPNTTVENIIFLETVKGLADNSFKDCNNLKEISIPDTVTTIGSNVFRNCENVETVYIPDSVREIGAWSFSELPKITECSLPNNSYVWEGAYYRCDAIESVTIPDTVRIIEDDAFQCAKLRNIVLGKKVERISNRCFRTAADRVNINIPDSLTYIGLWSLGNVNLYATFESDQAWQYDKNACYFCYKGGCVYNYIYEDEQLYNIPLILHQDVPRYRLYPNTFDFTRACVLGN